MILLSEKIADHLFVRSAKSNDRSSCELSPWQAGFTGMFVTFNFGTTGLSNKSIVCVNRSFLTNAAYAFSVVLTEA